MNQNYAAEKRLANQSVDRLSSHNAAPGSRQPRSRKSFADDNDLFEIPGLLSKSGNKLNTDNSEKSYSFIEQISNGSGFDRLPQGGVSNKVKKRGSTSGALMLATAQNAGV